VSPFSLAAHRSSSMIRTGSFAGTHNLPLSPTLRRPSTAGTSPGSPGPSPHLLLSSHGRSSMPRLPSALSPLRGASSSPGEAPGHHLTPRHLQPSPLGAGHTQAAGASPSTGTAGMAAHALPLHASGPLLLRLGSTPRGAPSPRAAEGGSAPGSPGTFRPAMSMHRRASMAGGRSESGSTAGDMAAALAEAGAAAPVLRVTIAGAEVTLPAKSKAGDKLSVARLYRARTSAVKQAVAADRQGSNSPLGTPRARFGSTSGALLASPSARGSGAAAHGMTRSHTSAGDLTDLEVGGSDRVTPRPSVPHVIRLDSRRSSARGVHRKRRSSTGGWGPLQGVDGNDNHDASGWEG
jgi:hypothetical protein